MVLRLHLSAPALCVCACHFMSNLCVCLHLECGPHLSLSTEEVQKQASHCNDKKTVSKRVQELSTELFFGVFVKVGRLIPNMFRLCYITCFTNMMMCAYYVKLVRNGLVKPRCQYTEVLWSLPFRNVALWTRRPW